MKFACEKHPNVQVENGEGVRLQFVDGEFETEDKAEVAALTALAPLVKAVIQTEEKPKGRGRGKAAKPESETPAKDETEPETPAESEE